MFVHFPVNKWKGCFCLFSDSETDTAFAIVDQVTQGTLTAILQVPHDIRFEAVFETAVLSKRKKGLARKSVVLENISINIFGPQKSHVENEIAKRLSKLSVFLQHPKALSLGIQYRNPQFFVAPGEEPNFDHLIGVSNGALGLSNLRSRVRGEVDNILESLNVVSVKDMTPLIHPNSLTARFTR